MDLRVFFEALAFAGAVALITYVYKGLLFRELVLHWWLRFGERYERKWFFKPIWGCYKCIAGQLALWGYLFTHLSIHYAANYKGQGSLNNFPVYVSGWSSYSITGHIMAVCAAILFADILSIQLNKYYTNN
jgi:hypothetical protein